MILNNSQIELVQIIFKNENITFSSEEFVFRLIENGVNAIYLNEKQTEIPKNILGKLQSLDLQLQILTKLQLQEIRRLTAKLNKANIEYLILKGWALSYTNYNKPHLRPKTDIDIIINGNDKELVKKIFEDDGYYNPKAWEPVAIIDQFSMKKILNTNVPVYFDIHLKISNDKLLQRSVEWTELWNNRRFNYSLNAYIPTEEIILFHAIIHLLNHYSKCDLIKIVWLYDIYILIKSFNLQKLNKFSELVEQKGLKKPTILLLEELNEYIFNPNTVVLLKKLNRIEDKSNKFNYLIDKPSKIKSLIRTVTHSKGFTKKMKVLRETIFPPLVELQKKYQVKNKFLLLLFYFYRIISRIWKEITLLKNERR